MKLRSGAPFSVAQGKTSDSLEMSQSLTASDSWRCSRCVTAEDDSGRQSRKLGVLLVKPALLSVSAKDGARCVARITALSYIYETNSAISPIADSSTIILLSFCR